MDVPTALWEQTNHPMVSAPRLNLLLILETEAKSREQERQPSRGFSAQGHWALVFPSPGCSWEGCLSRESLHTDPGVRNLEKTQAGVLWAGCLGLRSGGGILLSLLISTLLNED